MADIALGVAGGVVGSFFGNPMLGFSVGMALGGVLFPPKLGEMSSGSDKPNIQESSYGSPIPIIYGTERTAGVIVWGTEPRQVIEESGGGKNEPSTKTYKNYISFAVKVCEGEIYRINRIWANNRVIYDNRSGTGYVAESPVETHNSGAIWESYLDHDNVRIYLGSDNQGRDPLIEADLGTSDTPAYCGFPIVVFEDLLMGPFGDGLPNLEFEVQTTEEGYCTLEYVMNDLCDRCEIGPDFRDFSDLASIQVKGLKIDSRTETKTVFETLQKAYLFDIVEYDGKMRGLRCSEAATLSFDSDILGADVDRPHDKQYELTRLQEIELPKQLNLTYRTSALDFQQFTQNAVRVSGGSDEPESLVFPLVMGEEEAKKAAMANLFLKDMRRNSAAIQYPMSGLKYAPGNVISVNLEEIGEVKLKIVENYIDFFGIIRSIAVFEDQRVYTQSAVGTEVYYPNIDTGDQESLFRLIDTGALIDSHSDSPCIYFAGTGKGKPWKGAIVKPIGSGYVWQSSGYWSSYSAKLEVGATIGTVIAPLPSWNPNNIVQEDTEILVTLLSGSLSSCTRSDLIMGKNLAAWGDELIQFKTATFVSGSTWKLTGILRARRGTEWARSHSANEQFILIDSRTIRAFIAGDLEHGQTKTHGMYEGEVNYNWNPTLSIEHALESNSSKALSPVKPVIERDGGGNVTISWVRRDRKGFSWDTGTDIPMSEPVLGYDVEVWTTNYGTLKRTITVTTEGATYSSANQVSDFGSNQSTLWIKIMQKQATRPWLRGHALEYQG